MNVIWTRRARNELAHHYAYIAADSVAAAESQIRLVLRSVEPLADFPGIGRPGRVAGTRELVAHGTPSILPYAVVRKQIYILAVIHGKQQWPIKF